jgi:hypothetical protein
LRKIDRRLDQLAIDLAEISTRLELLVEQTSLAHSDMVAVHDRLVRVDKRLAGFEDRVNRVGDRLRA